MEVAALLGVSIDVEAGDFLDTCFILTREIAEDGPYIDHIAGFLALLDGKFADLGELGISRSDISIWLLRTYRDQCNMEFAPQTLLHLGEEGLALCVSCWQESGEART
ncbi:hypothetical protein OJ996_03275 [Luteolibacter sp. GHJ8]|uniref:Uncharacterized protein n=1 Tax=Luteolibacter rhizosphaerae TaxID=2989719 RepID=A0ABT3FYB3_9BACT|nr:hypothetical protein [Luteolibacter rhizosphaerae]